MSGAWPDKDCPICGRQIKPARYRSVLMRRLPPVINSTLVCKRCRNAFVNRRQAAFLLDWILWVCLYFSLVGTLEELLIARVGLSDEMSVAAFILFAFKDGFRGMSLGKWLFDLRVVDRTTLEPIGFKASFFRNVHLAVPMLGPLFILVVALGMDAGPRWGDGWARTTVIWRRHAHKPPFDPRGIFCAHCGYNLTGNVSGICPECGTPVARQGAAQAHV